MSLREVLESEVLRAAEPELLAGAAGLDRPVRWVHSSEIYEIFPLLEGGELLLTTGLGLAGADAGARRHYIREIAARRVAGVALELGRTFVDVPPELVDEARRLDLPLVVLHAVVPFIRIAEAINTTLVERRSPAPEEPSERLAPGRGAERQRRAARALGALLDDAVRGTAGSALRDAGAGVAAGRRLLGVAVAAPEARTGTALLDGVARTFGDGPPLRAAVHGTVLGVLATPPHGDAVGPVTTALTAALPAGTTATVGPVVAPTAPAAELGASLRAARTALDLPRAEPVTSTRELTLELALAAAGPAELDAMVAQVLGPLVEHDRRQGTALVETLEVHLRHGSSPTRSATVLHVVRQALYQRLDRIEAVLGYSPADPRMHAALVAAATAYRLRAPARGNSTA